MKHPICGMTCAGFGSCIILTSSLPLAHGGDAPSHWIMAGPSKGTWVHLHQGARWSLEVHQENVGTSFLVILILIVSFVNVYILSLNLYFHSISAIRFYSNLIYILCLKAFLLIILNEWKLKFQDGYFLWIKKLTIFKKMCRLNYHYNC